MNFCETGANQLTRLILLACGLLIAQGCNGSGLPTLTGSVTVDGEPAPAGIALEFSPLIGGSPSYAVTDSDGKFEAAYTFKKKGIELGEHRIKLYPGGGSTGREKMPEPGTENNLLRGAEASPKLPNHYFSEIMKMTIGPGTNTVTIPLESQKN